MNKKISIIVAVKAFNENLRECIEHSLVLDYDDYEIIILPDEAFAFDDTKVRVIPTGPCLPAKKRDLGSKYAQGEILAFLDDDAYPVKDWLKRAVKNFSDPDVAAVGGPAITPPADRFLCKASGKTYESFLVSGHFRYRYRKEAKQYVEDYPSCNLLVRKDIFDSIGGFQTKFWPGEDTILCLEITRNLSKKIVYDPEVIVFHHRRALFGPHLKQIKNYALHRGYFVKHFPQTSLKWQYFVPSLFFLWLIFGIALSTKNDFAAGIFLASLIVYFFLDMVSAFQKNNLKMTLVVAIGTFLTHCTYGLYFLGGLLKKQLHEETSTL